MPPRDITELDGAVQKRILFSLCFIIFFSVLNGTMFQVAAPDISRTYEILPSQVSWVMTAYIVVFAVGTLFYGKLADSYPVKNLITFGLLLMALGSLAGFFSGWYPMVIAARIVQAGGGAAIPALAMLVVTKLFRVERRGRTFGIIASTVALASAAGPVLGGFISGMIHWKYLFLISIPTVVAIPCFRRYLPERKLIKKRFDLLGAVLIICTVLFFLVFVTKGNLWSLAAASVTAFWFVFHLRYSDVPFLNPGLFQISAYRNLILGSFLSVGTVFGMLFVIPLMLRDLNSLPTDRIGLIMFPGAISAVVFGTLGGRFSDRIGSKFVVYAGVGLLTAGFSLLSISSGLAPWVVSLNLIICYAGFSFLQSSLPHTISVVLPADQTAVGMGIYNLIFFISGAFSTALIGRILDFRSDPLADSAAGGIYSSIFLMLAAAIMAACFSFIRSFRIKEKLQGKA